MQSPIVIPIGNLCQRGLAVNRHLIGLVSDLNNDVFQFIQH